MRRIFYAVRYRFLQQVLWIRNRYPYDGLARLKLIRMTYLLTSANTKFLGGNVYTNNLIRTQITCLIYPFANLLSSSSLNKFFQQVIITQWYVVLNTLSTSLVISKSQNRSIYPLKIHFAIQKNSQRNSHTPTFSYGMRAK